jgi:glycosyltransferase involved in cell wall biosynthesis
MKILMLLDNTFQSDIRVEKEAIDLIAQGHNLTVMCVTDPSLPTEDERAGITIKRRFSIEIKSPFRKGYKQVVDDAVTAILAEDYDALHCHDYHMLHLGTLAKAKLPKPLIYDAHEYLTGWPFYKDSVGFINRFKGRLVWRHEINNERKNLGQVDHVVTVSQAISDAMTECFKMKVPPMVVRNIPRKYEINGDRAAFKQRYKIPADQKVILYSGAMYHTDRQIKVLYNIVSKIDGLVVLILGSLKRHAEVRKTAQDMGFENKHVYFGEYESNPEVRQDLISGADIALMHLRSKWIAHRITFSNKFVEYTFAGLPIVSAYQNDCVDIGKKYGHALFYEEDEDAVLEQNIKAALEQNEQLRQNLPQAREELSWEKEVAVLLDFYSNMC